MILVTLQPMQTARHSKWQQRITFGSLEKGRRQEEADRKIILHVSDCLKNGHIVEVKLATYIQLKWCYPIAHVFLVQMIASSILFWVGIQRIQFITGLYFSTFYLFKYFSIFFYFSMMSHLSSTVFQNQDGGKSGVKMTSLQQQLLR